MLYGVGGTRGLREWETAQLGGVMALVGWAFYARGVGDGGDGDGDDGDGDDGDGEATAATATTTTRCSASALNNPPIPPPLRLVADRPRPVCALRRAPAL